MATGGAQPSGRSSRRPKSKDRWWDNWHKPVLAIIGGVVAIIGAVQGLLHLIPNIRDDFCKTLNMFCAAPLQQQDSKDIVPASAGRPPEEAPKARDDQASAGVDLTTPRADQPSPQGKYGYAGYSSQGQTPTIIGEVYSPASVGATLSPSDAPFKIPLLPDDVEKRKYKLIAYLKDQASEKELEKISFKFGIELGPYQGLRSQIIRFTLDQ
jgi:hypothetical protein